MASRLSSWTSAPAGGTAAGVLLVCAGYYVGGVVGIELMFPSSEIAILWPPNPILLAALLLTPPRQWWWYLLAAIPTHFHLVAHFQPDVPVVTMLCQVFGNIVQAVLAALAVRRFSGAPPRLDTLRSMTAFLLLAALAAPCAVAALVAYLFVLTGWTTDFLTTWRLRFLANVFAIFTLTPLILLTVHDGWARMRAAPVRRYVEFGLLVVGLFALWVPLLGLEGAGPGSYPALLYAPLPLLLWAAVRFGPAGVCLSLLVVALLSLLNAFAGRGPFVTQSPAENVLALQLYLIALSAPLLFLAALMEERRQATAALRAREQEAHRQYAQRKRAEEALRQNETVLRASHARIQDLAGRLIAAQEAERTRIARELHDDINQQLAALAIALGGLRHRLPAGAADLSEELARLQQHTVELSGDVRNLSHELHPGMLRHAGLAAALRAHCAEFGGRHGLEISLQVEAGLDGIPADMALCLYRVAQEALQNVARHASAQRVGLALAHLGKDMELTITDDGQGFDLAEARHAGGLGLLSLDERVRLVRGSVRIDTRPGEGTALRVQVPLGGPEHAPREGTARRRPHRRRAGAGRSAAE